MDKRKWYDGFQVRWVWELVVVIAATLAVVTNAMIIAANVDASRQLQRMQSDIDELNNRMTEYEDYAAATERRLLELQAQVMFGLRERYEVE